MVRTQIYLSEEEQRKLKSIATATGLKRSELIRNAVDVFIDSYTKNGRLDRLQKGKGIWRQRTDLPDFAAIRKGLDR